MLGRLRMDMADCIDTFIEFSQALFNPKRGSLDPRRAIDFVKANGKFDEQPLEALVKQKIRTAGLDENCLLKDERSDSCKV